MLYMLSVLESLRLDAFGSRMHSGHRMHPNRAIGQQGNRAIGQQAIGNRQQAIGNRQQAIGNRQQAIGYCYCYCYCYCLLPIAYCLLPIAYSPIRIAPPWLGMPPELLLVVLRACCSALKNPEKLCLLSSKSWNLKISLQSKLSCVLRLAKVCHTMAWHVGASSGAPQLTLAYLSLPQLTLKRKPSLPQLTLAYLKSVLSLP